jgi:hypothetical protein
MNEFPIIVRLGGRDAVAGILGVKSNSVRMWTARGRIPQWHAQQLWAEAERRGIQCRPADFALAQQRDEAINGAADAAA